VRLQRNFLRRHPRKQQSTGGASKLPPSAQLGSKKLASFKKKKSG
jgi:hypothetical protein